MPEWALTPSLSHATPRPGASGMASKPASSSAKGSATISSMYGAGVMPPQPEGIWEHPYLGNLWKESKNEDKYRRGIYTYLKRTSPYPSLMTFDAGSREVCLVRRSPSNTPLQALVTMNDPVYLEAAFNLAYLNKDKSVENGINRVLKFNKVIKQSE